MQWKEESARLEEQVHRMEFGKGGFGRLVGRQPRGEPRCPRKPGRADEFYSEGSTQLKEALMDRS
jgi:hypothetical protein